MSSYSFDAVIFDLDGIITKTASVHSRAWKLAFDEYLHLREKRNNEAFREFTSQDYLDYIDGRPRYEGVKGFLESRNIFIEWGDPSDSIDKETTCGIGNRKNLKFNEVIKEKGVETYPSTINLIKELKNKGIKIGVASSSKNCQRILERAGLQNLFATRVDGVVSSELKLKGKPEGDIFVTAASNLETEPKKAVIVEDASSGVQAGRNGGFGLVIGVARENNEEDLLKHHADVVVSDLSSIDMDWIDGWFRKRPPYLFDSWGDTKIIQRSTSEVLRNKKIAINPAYMRTAEEALFSKKRIVFFLDYDGTLTPIVDRPELAILSEEMRETIKNLVAKHTTAVVSGRMRSDVEDLVGIENIFYAGSHGFDICGPSFSIVAPEVRGAIPLISQIIERLYKELNGIEGLLIEEKKFSVAVHYRLVEDKFFNRIKDFVQRLTCNNTSLRLLHGKKVFEIMPAVDWNKGKALRWIMQALKINWDEATVVYIGDDTTDEDAFRAVRGRGVGILVSEASRPSAADFRVANPIEVKSFFEEVIKLS